MLKVWYKICFSRYKEVLDELHCLYLRNVPDENEDDVIGVDSQ